MTCVPNNADGEKPVTSTARNPYPLTWKRRKELVSPPFSTAMALNVPAYSTVSASDVGAGVGPDVGSEVGVGSGVGSTVGSGVGAGSGVGSEVGVGSGVGSAVTTGSGVGGSSAAAGNAGRRDAATIEAPARSADRRKRRGDGTR
jgi:hypothetical protein